MHSDALTRHVMGDVLIAMLPATLAGAWFFGARVLLVCIVSIASCVLAEYVCRLLMRRDNTIGDFSAMVTGLLLALVLPPSIELWKVAVGGAAAIVIGKQVFGGLGQNFMNPALVGRIILLTSWGASMTRWTAPVSGALFGAAGGAAGAAIVPDAISMATPLALAKGFYHNGSAAAQGGLPAYADLFFGAVAGCIGEVSALALLLGGIYLLVRGVISWHIPVVYIGTTAALTWAFGLEGALFGGDPLRHVLSGGLLLGAFFMATDYTTSPMTNKGKLIMGAGCGFLTVVIRLFTNSPEGVSYAILIMNAATPLIDRYTVPAAFGGEKARGSHR
ncbi:MAG: RnfABCDGE type electron transport complex subunit D [Oscillospiraceae bacterium]|nr:RnfABCDGE type electron transport complex subunit D [Oscillospiraceae bacterium]